MTWASVKLLAYLTPPFPGVIANSQRTALQGEAAETAGSLPQAGASFHLLVRALVVLTLGLFCVQVSGD